MPQLLWSQYHVDFESDSVSGPDLFPGFAWEQQPPNRWKRSMDQAIEGDFSLQHAYDNPESGCDYLLFNHDGLGNFFGSSPEEADSLVLSFRIRHGYAPSISNNWQLALLARFQEEVPQIQEGIVLGVNFAGSDDLIRVWQSEGGVPAERMVTPLNYQEEVGTEEAPEFRLVCHADGWLHLYYRKDPAEEKLQLLGSCLLEQMAAGRQLVIRHKYTSARDRKLWFDELILEGPFTVDSLPPKVTETKVQGEKIIRISFSEEIVDPSEESFMLGERTPDKIWGEGRDVFLEFSDPFPNRELLEIRIGGICDVDQNCLRDTVITFMRNEALWGDVVFNEIMADPEPTIRLPPEEYLELYNRSEYPLDLDKWRLEINTRSYSLSSLISLSSPQILPGAYALLKDLTLPNEGAVLALYNEQGHLIHGVSYRVPWGAPEWKKQGGWALESPDPHQSCLISQRWVYSENPSGGTPGGVNSQETMGMDQEPPLMLYYGYGETGEMILYYSEPLQPDKLEREDFMIRPGSVCAEKVSLSSPLASELVLRFSEDLQDRRLFRMELPVLADCQGNLSRKETLIGGEIQAPAHRTLLINEIMYHPQEGFPEYVEVYNPGTDYCDLQEFSFHVVEKGESPDRPHPLSSRSRICLPGQFLVLTSCVPWLEEAYGLAPSGSWVEMEDLPSMKNSGGALWLTDRAGSVVDQVTYSEEMHMELLSDSRGISLERISSDRPGNEQDNWHSAASIAGYATPGRENSQAADSEPGMDLLEVEPSVFSPDNDGFEDVLKIQLRPGATGWTISLWISDLSGVLVRQLANNHLAASSLSYTWDGEGEDGSLVAMGFYVLIVRAYHPSTGERWVRRKVVGLVYR